MRKRNTRQLRLHPKFQPRILAIFKIIVAILFLFICGANGQEQSGNSSAIRAAGKRYIPEHIDLKAGERRPIRAPEKLSAVGVTRPEVVEGYLSGDKDVLLAANSPGLGKVILQFDNGGAQVYTVRVFVADPDTYADALRERLKDIRNLNIEVISGKILVEGSILSQNDLSLIERAVADNPSVLNLTFLNPRSPHALARRIGDRLEKGGIDGVKVEINEGKLVLTGSVASKNLKRKAENIAASYTSHFTSLLRTEAQ